VHICVNVVDSKRSFAVLLVARQRYVVLHNVPHLLRHLVALHASPVHEHGNERGEKQNRRRTHRNHKRLRNIAPVTPLAARHHDRASRSHLDALAETRVRHVQHVFRLARARVLPPEIVRAWILVDAQLLARCETRRALVNVIAALAVGSELEAIGTCTFRGVGHGNAPLFAAPVRREAVVGEDARALANESKARLTRARVPTKGIPAVVVALRVAICAFVNIRALESIASPPSWTRALEAPERVDARSQRQ